MPMMIATARRCASFALLSTLAACAGGERSAALLTPTAPSAASEASAAPLQLAPAPRLVPGERFTLGVVNGNSTDDDRDERSVRWTSSDVRVATVARGGEVLAIAPGVTTITGDRGVHASSIELTVTGGGMLRPQGGTATAADGGAVLRVEAGAVDTDVAVQVIPATEPTGDEHVVAGSVYAMTPADLALAQPGTVELRYDGLTLPEGAPLAGLRVARLVGSESLTPSLSGASRTLFAAESGRWELIAATTVDSVRGVVRAPVTTLGTFAVVVDSCVVGVLPLTILRGRISSTDCLFPFAGRRSDYFAFTRPASQMVTITTTGPLVGIVGIKEATADPAMGGVYRSAPVGDTIRLITNGDPLQLFVSGQDSTQLGNYTATTSVAAPAYVCRQRRVGVMPGASFLMLLNGANSCIYPVQFSPVGPAIGKLLHAHSYAVRLIGGRAHTITLGRLSPSLDLGLTVFDGTGRVVAQQVPNGSGATSRSVGVTPLASAIYFVEVSSGKFTDATLTTWINQSGTYSLSVTR